MADKRYKMTVTLTDGRKIEAARITVPQVEGVPSGGTAGQFLQKTADGTAWADVTGGGSNVIIYADSFESSHISVGNGEMEIYFALPEPNAPSNPYMARTDTSYGRYATAKLLIMISDDPMTIIDIDVPTTASNGVRPPVVARAAGGVNASVAYSVSSMNYANPGIYYIDVTDINDITAPTGLSIAELEGKTLVAMLHVNNFVVEQST